MDAQIFHEFVPVESLGEARPPRHWARTVEAGVEYAIALTTASGLWGTYLGDTVRFASLRPHRVRFTGRTEQFLNAFGEHLRAADAEAAIVSACAATAASVVEFHVAPILPTAASQRRGHQWFVEFAREPDDRTAFVRALDDALRARNVDYDEHRRDATDLSMPRLVAVPRGTFLAAMAGEGRSGGQHKVPHVRGDRRFAAALEALTRCAESSLAAN
jgi:hypothetical protein